WSADVCSSDLTFGVLRQQRQLIQRLLKLRGRFCHRRTGDGPPTGLAPISDGFFNEPGLGIMLREQLRLAFDDLGEMAFERFADLRMQLPPGVAQHAVVRRVLHQRMLEGIECLGRCAALEYQLGSDEPGESGLQLARRGNWGGLQYSL